MSDIPQSSDGRRLLGKAEVDPAEADGEGPPTKEVAAGKHKHVEVPIRTGEGGGGAGGGSPGETTYSPTSAKEAGIRSSVDAINQKHSVDKKR